MKPGRYIRIGKLLVPIDGPPARAEIYKIGPTARAARRAEYRANLKSDRVYTNEPRRTSTLGRIWAILQGGKI